MNTTGILTLLHRKIEVTLLKPQGDFSPVFNIKNLSFVYEHFCISRFNILTENYAEVEYIKEVDEYLEVVSKLFEQSQCTHAFLENHYLKVFLEEKYYKLKGKDFNKFIFNIYAYKSSEVSETNYSFTEENGVIIIEDKNEIAYNAAAFDILTEDMNRHQLQAKNDPNFLKQKERMKDVPSTRFVDINKDIILFRTWSADHKKNHKEYTERIRLVDLYANLIAKKKTLKKGEKMDERTIKDTVKDSILNGDLEIFCSCPAFLFWGFRFIAKKYHALAKHGLTTFPYTGNVGNIDKAPVKRNPSLRGMYCKHLAVVMGALPFITARVAKKFSDKYL